MLNIPKCKRFTLLVCPLRFLVISAMRRPGNVQSFKTYAFRFGAFCHERDPGQADHPTLRRLHGKLSPRLTGLPYLADRAARLGGSPRLSYKRDQDKVRNYMDRRVIPPRRVTSPNWCPRETSLQLPGVVRLHVNVFYFSTAAKRVTSPTWGPPPPCKQALKQYVCVVHLFSAGASNFICHAISMLAVFALWKLIQDAFSWGI